MPSPCGSEHRRRATGRDGGRADPREGTGQPRGQARLPPAGVCPVPPHPVRAPV